MTVEYITLHLTLTHINNFTSSCTFYQRIQSHVTNIHTRGLYKHTYFTFITTIIWAWLTYRIRINIYLLSVFCTKKQHKLCIAFSRQEMYSMPLLARRYCSCVIPVPQGWPVFAHTRKQIYNRDRPSLI